MIFFATSNHSQNAIDGRHIELLPDDLRKSLNHRFDVIGRLDLLQRGQTLPLPHPIDEPSAEGIVVENTVKIGPPDMARFIHPTELHRPPRGAPSDAAGDLHERRMAGG